MPKQHTPLLLTDALLCDGASPPAPGALLLEGGRITRRFNPGEKLPIQPEALSLRGHMITPGLIDAHTHLFLSGESSPMGYEKMLLQESLPFRTLRGVHNASLMLDFGFTTVRDVCTEGASYADVALREAIRAGLCAGPRIYPSGPGVGITGGYIPTHLAPGVCIPMGCAICDGVDAVRREVRAQSAQGVAWIKVFADWPCRPTDPESPSEVRPTFLREELTALIEEATRRGRKVAAHATSDEGARLAIECGAASIEHMGDLSSKTLSLAAKRGVFLVPTLSVSRFMFDTAKEEHKSSAARRYEKVVKGFSRALAAGVSIVCGTDIGCYPFALGSLRELELLCALGMTPLAALYAATGEAARLLGRDDLGVIKEGAVADLCVFSCRDEQLSAALFEKRPAMVIQAGEIIRR